MIELGRKYIDIDIENCVFSWIILYVLIYLIFILYADYIRDKSTSECRLNIVPDIAIEIRKIPSITLISDCSFELEFMGIIPEIRVFIDMDNIESFLDYSSTNSIDPKIESMIMVIEYDNFLLFLPLATTS